MLNFKLGMLIREIFIANQKKKILITKKSTKSELQILKLLFQDNLILSYKKKDKDIYDIFLKPINSNLFFKKFKIISKPGRRIYVSVAQLKEFIYFNPFNIAYISTSYGILNLKTAIKYNVGGEFLVIVQLS
jgi:ribosomal protein S8